MPLPATPWTYGQMGDSTEGEPTWFVRSDYSSALSVMVDGPDVALCASESVAVLVSLAPTMLAELRLAFRDRIDDAWLDRVHEIIRKADGKQ